MPPKDAVRIEELINYFSYNYPQPEGDAPFSVNVEIAPCPWNADHKLARIGLKGKEIKQEHRPPANLVFLLDVSGSMASTNKLPLLKSAFKLLVNQLDEKDRVAIVVYAGASGLVLPSTTCDRKTEIIESLDRLNAGGSTNGGAGIELAYKTVMENFDKDGINRVILATDGDFNVGTTNQGDLIRMIEDKAKKGAFLTVLGFGMGNYKDSTLEKLADKGNGNYAYIDTFKEARKVFAEQISGTLFTIAKDVKIQVEFNPAKTLAYRLIGYENRLLKNEDFNDDKKDAGEIGAGHTVTALYQIVPVGKEIGIEGGSVDGLKYQKPPQLTDAASGDELMTVKLRYKKPDGVKSKLIEYPIADPGLSFAQASEDFKFASSVASFGMLLRDSQFKGNATYASVLEIADGAKGPDKHGYRTEFIDLVKTAKQIN
jgi:Ca-activated chloride channel family protein